VSRLVLKGKEISDALALLRHPLAAQEWTAMSAKAEAHIESDVIRTPDPFSAPLPHPSTSAKPARSPLVSLEFSPLPNNTAVVQCLCMDSAVPVCAIRCDCRSRGRWH